MYCDFPCINFNMIKMTKPMIGNTSKGQSKVSVSACKRKFKINLFFLNFTF